MSAFLLHNKNQKYTARILYFNRLSLSLFKKNSQSQGPNLSPTISLFLLFTKTKQVS